ncbi:MAG: hypothetical protein FJ082_11535 [Cyanobacteria bacterium K_Offshore_surface_m2_011]|nr:hypothetical protein [Cyanobacteria bacterium K_Offshore_surface_m2_011]
MKRELPFRDDAEIARLVRAFEALSLPRANWTHRAHLAVGVHYVRHWGLDGALQRLAGAHPGLQPGLWRPRRLQRDDHSHLSLQHRCRHRR